LLRYRTTTTMVFLPKNIVRLCGRGFWLNRKVEKF